jgi:hypothetical protein
MTDFFDRRILPHKCGVPPGLWNAAFMRQLRFLSRARASRVADILIAQSRRLNYGQA